jgi:hypothetical protein
MVRLHNLFAFKSNDPSIEDELSPEVDLIRSIQLPPSKPVQGRTCWDIKINDDGEPMLPEYDTDKLSGPQRKALIWDYMNAHYCRKFCLYLSVLAE